MAHAVSATGIADRAPRLPFSFMYLEEPCEVRETGIFIGMSSTKG